MLYFKVITFWKQEQNKEQIIQKRLRLDLLISGNYALKSFSSFFKAYLPKILKIG
jgi:hypothetical protein